MPSSPRPFRFDGRIALAPVPSSSRIARHDLLMTARAVLPVLAAGPILMLVLVPVSTSLVESVSVFNVSYTHDQLKYQFFAQQLAPAVREGDLAWLAVACTVGMAGLMALRWKLNVMSLGDDEAALLGAPLFVYLICRGKRGRA